MNGIEEERVGAVVRADVAAQAWQDVVRHQRWAQPDHADFYALAGDLVATLHALEDLTRVLAGQVTAYAIGRAVYDDTREVDPAVRLAEAAAQLVATGDYLADAGRAGSAYWSAIGHIGVEVAP